MSEQTAQSFSIGLQGANAELKHFVNRTSQVAELVMPHSWRHVNRAENPTDCTSRGLMPSEILDHDLWWQGPDWLRRDVIF